MYTLQSLLWRFVELHDVEWEILMRLAVAVEVSSTPRQIPHIAAMMLVLHLMNASSCPLTRIYSNHILKAQLFHPEIHLSFLAGINQSKVKMLRRAPTKITLTMEDIAQYDAKKMERDLQKRRQEQMAMAMATDDPFVAPPQDSSKNQRSKDQRIGVANSRQT